MKGEATFDFTGNVQSEGNTLTISLEEFGLLDPSQKKWENAMLSL